MSIIRRQYRCCYVDCNARSCDANPATIFFCFPKKNNLKRLQAWVRNAGYENVESETLSLVHERICSKHFTADSFTTPAHEKLKRMAVPIHYGTKSAIDLENIMPEHSSMAKEHIPSQKLNDISIEADTIEVDDDPP